MSAPSNKDVVRRWIRDVWDEGKIEAIPELTTSEYVYVNPQDGEVSGDAFLRLLREFRSAFPDLRNTVEEQIAEGDAVVTRGTSRATHRGVFAGVAPTGKLVTVRWIVISHLRDGRIVRDFEIPDSLGLMQQLGAVPTSAVTAV